MPDDDFDNFDPFEELDAANARRQAGAGLNVWGRPLVVHDPLRQARPGCPRPATQEDNAMKGKRSKFTPEQLADIRKNYAAKTVLEWAAKFGVSDCTIYNLAKAEGLTRPRTRTARPVAKAAAASTPATASPPRLIGTRPAADAADPARPSVAHWAKVAQAVPVVKVADPGEIIVRLRIRIDKLTVEVIEED